MVLKRACPLIAVTLLIAGCSSWGAGPNLYPDPSFEASGVAGVARTGEKAGHLKVGKRNHWGYIGDKLAVEPFARYRVTEWVKADISKGNFYAPYCYQWNNYEWSFAVSRPIETLKDWTKIELTFVSPYEDMYVHPLAYIDAENSEAWVDDIVVEKIAEPEETMARMEANAKRSPNGDQLLARWYIQQGKMDKARELLPLTDGLTRTDIACLIARKTDDVAERRPFVVEMVAYGGPTYHDGLRRFDQITEGMSDEDKLEVCKEAVIANPGLDRAGRSFRLVLGHLLMTGDSLLTVSEAAANIAYAREATSRLLQELPDNSPSAKEVRLAMEEVSKAGDELEARRASLGHCVVKIGGKALGPDSHVIVIPDDPTPQEGHAAKDLRYHLELITGEALPIRYEKLAGGLTPILVGNCNAVKTLAPEIDFDSLGIEGIHIKTVGPSLVLAGNKRGVLYATYTFLEDYLGCRWFAPDCSTWPTEGTIEVPEIDKRYIPPLEYRATDYPSSRPGDFAVRNKYNGTSHHLDEAHGGKISYKGFVHTFNSLVPPQKYFAQHPEYYSEINGKRVGPEHTQLCLTNPDVLRIATETVRRWIEEAPDATIISVSQNDWHNYCQCPNCSALAEKEGSQSGPLLHFVNAIADNIKDDYPNIIIDTLAYQYTRKPPKHVKPRPNVAVRLCSIECCFIHPLATDPYNASFVRDIKGWNRICNRLYIWDYVINYAHSICPFPNLYVLKPNINFFINNGVKGVYEEACYYTKGSEFQELRSYLMAKLLWDPSYDTDKAIDEFCAAYYGAGGKYVREYINVVQQSAQSIPNMHVRIYSPPSVGYLTPEVLAKSRELFDQAEEAVKDDSKLLHRVQVARLPIMYAQIALARGATFAERGDKLVQESGTNVAALADRFEKIARAEGVTRVREGGPLKTLDAWLASIPRRPRAVQIERLRNSALEMSVLPEMGGRIWRLKLLPSGRDLLHLVGEENAWQPGASGYEEYSESGYRSPGWNELYAVKDRSARAITMEANLRNGLRLTRSVELDAAKPLAKITSTVTNISSTRHTACLRIHPQFAVGSTRRASVRVRQGDNTWRTLSLANPADPQAEKDVWLRGGEMPAGAWAVVDEAADLAIVNRAAREQLGQCLLNWDGKQGRVNLELYSPEVKLAPGQSITIEQTYEVVQPASKLTG